MRFINQIRNIILNNSIKTNLLSLYSIIIVIMSLLLTLMLFYSIDLNHTYNKIMLNLENYHKIYYQINSVDKDIYLNITEQKKFNGQYYEQIINEVNNELDSISNNLDGSGSINSAASVALLKRTVKTLNKNINETNSLINNNSSYADREEMLNAITHIKDIIKDNVQELMEFNLTQSQERINAIKSSYNIALGIIIILFIIAIIASVSFLLLVIKDTVNKINIVSNQANKLAHGDLSIEQINFGKSNEFQVLALSFNKMKDNIKDYISKLSSSEMRISSILNALNDCIISTNSLGEIESCNNSIKKIFGYQKDEIMGQNINKLVDTIDFSRYKQDMFNNQKLIKNGKIIDEKYQLDGSKKDGTIIPIEVSYNEVEFEGQRLTTFIIHDVTQHKKVEKMKDEFISIVSHELRTPLTSIKGSIGLLTAGVLGTLSDKASEVLKIANNNCNRLSNLINDILDMEKIKAGKMDFEIKEYDLIPIVKESIDASLEYAKQYNIEYKIVDSIDSALVKVDKNRLIQVIFNLLSNAAKFSHANDTVNIEVTKVNNDTIRVSVQDTGIGIPEEFQDQIFNSFSQADSSDTRKKGGTGLGLNIAKEIISIMGGKLGFKSKLNEGSTFYIDLPEEHSL